MNIKIDKGTISASSTITLELGSGILFFSLPGAQYFYIYIIDYWDETVTPIHTSRTDIKVEKTSISRSVTITNNKTVDQSYNYFFIG